MVCKTDNCEKIFVSWTWLVGILSGLLITIGGLAWAGGSKMSTSDLRMESLESEVAKWKKVPADLDTIKYLLRKQ